MRLDSDESDAASRESELLRVSVTSEAPPEPNTNGEQRRSLAVAVKHSLENHALVLWDDFVLAMNPYRHCRRVHWLPPHSSSLACAPPETTAMATTSLPASPPSGRHTTQAQPHRATFTTTRAVTPPG